MTHNCDRRGPDCTDCWEPKPPASADIAETLKVRATRGAPPAAAAASINNGSPTFNVQTMQGDIINLGPMPPSEVAELLASRRRAR